MSLDMKRTTGAMPVVQVREETQAAFCSKTSCVDRQTPFAGLECRFQKRRHLSIFIQAQ
jgi:hypothetical protein